MVIIFGIEKENDYNGYDIEGRLGQLMIIKKIILEVERSLIMMILLGG